MHDVLQSNVPCVVNPLASIQWSSSVGNNFDSIPLFVPLRLLAVQPGRALWPLAPLPSPGQCSHTPQSRLLTWMAHSHVRSHLPTVLQRAGCYSLAPAT